VISYLTARPSRDLIGMVRQQVTQAWWEIRSKHDLCISEVVARECASGGPEAVARRMAVMEDLPLLRVTTHAVEIAKADAHRSLPQRLASERSGSADNRAGVAGAEGRSSTPAGGHPSKSPNRQHTSVKWG
jgi:hypothetical protein